MYLYPTQHTAVPTETDPSRGLADKGEAEVRNVTAHLKNLRIERIHHIGNKRARDDSEQTVARLKIGGMVCLERLEGDWSLEWAIPPNLSV